MLLQFFHGNVDAADATDSTLQVRLRDLAFDHGQNIFHHGNDGDFVSQPQGEMHCGFKATKHGDIH